MKVKALSLILFVLGASVFLFSENIYAESTPALVTAVNHNPYYFAEDDFGIDLLRYFDVPLTPYLTPGVTKDSSNEKIMDAYYKANSNVTSSIIEQTADRAISYVLHIESPEIFEKTTSFNFQLFNPETNPNEFTLQSIASKDKQGYYSFAARYINAGSSPEPFDLTIDVVTGDGTILQKWDYFDCKITYFETFLQNNLTFVMFTKSVLPEIRDYSTFDCSSRYMQADMQELHNPYTGYRGPADTLVYSPEKLDTLPSRNDTALSYLVSFSGGDFTEEITSQTFSQFGPLGETIPQYYPFAGTLFLDPQFFLESLVSKDKQGYYDLVSSYITAGKTPEPFDVTIDLVTGDGTPLLRWQYFDCNVSSFETYLQDSLVIIKFHPGSTPEIRDRAEFECAGTYLEATFDNLFSTYSKVSKNIDSTPIPTELGQVIPQDSDRAMSYVVNFENGDFDSTKTFRTFAKFVQSDIGEFNLQSLPSLDKNELYDVIISHSLNPGRVPIPFDVTVDLVAGDNTILQKWQYYQCGITNHQTELNDNLLGSRFSGKFISEIREITSFDCQGQDLVANPLKPINPSTSSDIAFASDLTHEPGGIIPDDGSRAMSYRVSLVGADVPAETFSSFSKFSTHGTTVTTDYDDTLVYTKEKPAFALDSLPSEDKENFYSLLAKYTNPGKAPQPFDVAVDIVTGDDAILQTWQYFDCHMVNYEVFLEDKIIVTKFNPSPASEIRDTAGFVCGGFHFETPQSDAFSVYTDVALNENSKITNGTSGVVPSNDDRPMSYVVKFSDGEAIIPHSFLTFAKFKQVGTTDFWLESLPSHDKKDFYDFIIKRFINSGKNPELFDVSVNLITGSGSTIQSWQYHNCVVTDFVTYRNDNLIESRFDNSPNSEIRDRSTFDCAGVYLDVENSDSREHNRYGLNFKEAELVVSPNAQTKSGISTHDIVCKENMELMLRNSNTLASCVHANKLETLQALGWQHIAKKQNLSVTDESSNSTGIHGVIPAKNEHSMKYVVHVVGSEIPDTLHQTKFSKFVPFTTADITIPTAQIFGIPIPIDAGITIDVVQAPDSTATYTVDVALEDLPLPIPYATISGDTSTLFGVIPHYEIGETPEFYLESLPAKDKIEFYKWMARYVNPGKTPDPVDIGVQILDGNDIPIQTWVYRDCKAISYQLFLEENLLMIKYHDQWASEIKDRVMFTCNGLHIDEL